MTVFLKQSTAIDIRVGPFVDVGDGFTPEVSVTVTGSDEAEILKSDGAATAGMSTTGGDFVAITDCDGWYDYTLQTGDVDTVGELVIVMQDDSVYLPVFVRAYVVEEAVYDAMYGASAVGPALASVVGALDDAANTGDVDTATTIMSYAKQLLDELSGTTGIATMPTLLDPANGVNLFEMVRAIAGATFASATDSNEQLQIDHVAIEADTTGINGDVMRGTDNAALAVVLGALATAANTGDIDTSTTVMAYAKQLLNEISGTVGIAAMPTGLDPASGINLFEMVRAAMGSTFATATDSLEQLQADHVAIEADTTGLNGDAMRGTDDAALAVVVGALADVAAAGDVTSADTIMQYIKQLLNELSGSVGITTMPSGLDPANGVNMFEMLRAAMGATFATATDSNEQIQILIAALNDISTGDVNTQVLDVMNVDTITLPGKEAPPLAPTHREAITWLYKVLRNRTTQTATLWALLADDETTVDAQATVSDDATTAIKQEIVIGA